MITTDARSRQGLSGRTGWFVVAHLGVAGLAWAVSGPLILAAMAEPPLIIAHRGASGYRPEHTLESYALAIEMGAGAIEPDLVITKDGVLIARHENEIGGTTDVADRFPTRRSTKTIDGREVTGWFTEDFTLAEIKSLRARERMPSRSQAFNGRFSIPTLDEVIDLAARQSATLGRSIAIYPETKHPSYFRALGLPLEERLVQALARRGWTSRTSPVFIQSFEALSLERLRSLTQVRLVQLCDAGADVSPARLRAIATYADGLGANKRLIVPATPDGRLQPPTSLVRAAQAAGLFVHVWTMRSDAAFLAPDYAGDPMRELRQFVDLGVNGLFTDFPDTAVAAVKAATPRQ